ncbi:MAG: hypothetical protein F7C38_05695 [Desulfurococcales archaeon]|nr:hypothetical protein [Desulfurococcales archaeon]
MKGLLVVNDSIPLSMAPAIPLFIAPRFPGGYDVVVAVSRLATGGLTVGSLGSLWSGEDGVRRASGGGRYHAEAGDYHVAIVLRSGSLRWVYSRYEEELQGDGVVGIGKSSGKPFVEVYTGRDPLGRIEELFPGLEEGDPIEPELLEPIAVDLARDEWRDPIEGGSRLASYRVASGRHYFGLVGVVGEEGLILRAWPDSTIHVYPPGLARSVVKEIGMAPPSMPLAFHAANGFLSLVEYAGVESNHIVEAFQGFIREAEKLAGGDRGQGGVP